MEDSSIDNETPGRSAPEITSGGLRNASFLGLLLTQWLGAMNDNIIRWLVIGVGKQYVEQAQVNMVLSVGTMCFVVPYLVLAAPAGYLADRFSKRKVIVGCKVAEVVIAALCVLAIYLGNIYFLFAVVATMGAQSALFGPAKLGSIPEMLKSDKISAANGLLGLTTVVATVAGTAIGNLLSDATMPKGQHHLWLPAVVMIGIAAVGWFTSLLIARLPAADPSRRFPWDAPAQTVRDLATLARSRALLRVALGIMFFWSLGALAQLNIDQYGFEGGAQRQSQITPLLIALVAGVGAGSVLAGIWSGGRVELGILPLGAGGVALSSILLFTVQGAIIDPTTHWTASYVAACAFLIMLGISAGLFDVPLAAYMQHHSPPESRGSILAASNFLTFAGMAVSAGAFAVLRSQQADGEPLFSARQIFLLCGLFTIPVFIYIMWRIPYASIRFLVWLATHTVYRVRVFGKQQLPERGGALLVSNHVTWIDAALLTVTSSRPLRLVVDAELLKHPL
ncbi:MAG: MFS transporter, partial [Planctomycetales bacterium]|nr:MFS transporter [Planctomycetales bacterium]